MISKNIEKVTYSYYVGKFKVITSENKKEIADIAKRFPKAEELLLLLKICYNADVSYISLSIDKKELIYQYSYYEEGDWEGNRQGHFEHGEDTYTNLLESWKARKNEWDKFKDIIYSIDYYMKELDHYHISYEDAKRQLEDMYNTKRL